MHVHIQSGKGEAKFWIEPRVEVASSQGFSRPEVAKIHRLVEKRRDEIRQAWERHFAT